MEIKQPEVEDEDDGPPPGWDSVPPPQLPPPAVPQPPRALASSSGEMGQMVCGSCRRLLSYPRGTRHIQCTCCQTVNLCNIMKQQGLPMSAVRRIAHQIGQVKCGSCAVLLMFPHGAQSVRCSSCRFVTEIGVHNRRPPLSVQQGRSPVPPNPVR